jgi:hypothetical protein
MAALPAEVVRDGLAEECGRGDPGRDSGGNDAVVGRVAGSAERRDRRARYLFLGAQEIAESAARGTGELTRENGGFR